MADTFSLTLKRLVDEKFPTIRAFVRVAYPPEQESPGSGYVSKVMAGAVPPPLDRLDAWADALDLKGDDREVFLDLAALAHLPEQVRGRFERMYVEYREVMKLTQDLKRLRK